MIDQTKIVADAIAKKYAELALTPEPREYWVTDTRNGNLLGPYPKLFEALTLTMDLNRMVARNTGQDTKPFTAHSNDGIRVDPGI